MKSHFETHDFITSRDIQKIFDVGLSQSKEILTKFVNENYLESLGGNRNRKYVLSSSNSFGTHQDKVVNYLQNNSYITNKEAQQLLNLKEDWVKNILNQMVSEGMIEAIGNNKGRKYKLNDSKN